MCRIARSFVFIAAAIPRWSAGPSRCRPMRGGLRARSRLSRARSRCKVVHIHWGGGTPSILGPGALIELSANIAERFDLTQIREYAIELDPRRIDPALAQALAQIGFNRVSLGIQDFAPQVQEASGRGQPCETVTRAVRERRLGGMDARDLDGVVRLRER